jgi:hypothetical protein
MKIIDLFENQLDLFENQNTIPHLYLDMDGVQANFDGYFHEHIHHKDKQDAIERIANHSPEAVYRLFRTLESMSSGMKLVTWLKSNKIPFTILSAPLRGEFTEACIQAKKDWLDEFNVGTSKTAIFTKDKFLYATHNQVPNILVDDWDKNLTAWKTNGGIAIKHDYFSTGDDTINQIKNIYAQFSKV